MLRASALFNESVNRRVHPGTLAPERLSACVDPLMSDQIALLRERLVAYVAFVRSRTWSWESVDEDIMSSGAGGLEAAIATPCKALQLG